MSVTQASVKRKCNCFDVNGMWVTLNLEEVLCSVKQGFSL